MTLYGVGLGPGAPDLVTVRGRDALREAEVVYSPGRLSRAVATEHVSEDRIGDVDFPMTRDEEELRRAWKEAAAEIAPPARDGDAAFVTLGDPNVYSTFGHLRRTLSAFHPDVDVEIVPGVSAVTAFATALGVEIVAGSSLALREAANGEAPVGPDRMILFKVTDAPATHEGLVEAGYDVVYGRRLYMEQGETLVTEDPSEIDERDYYTLAYAEKRGVEANPATAAWDDAASAASSQADLEGGTAATDGGTLGKASSEPMEDGGSDGNGSGDEVTGDRNSDGNYSRSEVEEERATAQACGDEVES